MPQSHSAVFIHIIFSTYGRAPLIRDSIAERLWAYIAGACNQQGCVTFAVGGVADHVHIACALARTTTQSDLIKEIKTMSTRWLRSEGIDGFMWQRGYGVFSFGPPQKRAIVNYIDNQREHHRTITFQEEVRRFLNRYGVSFDEAYLWD